MSAALNRVILIGRMTRDPELRRTANDVPVVSFNLAVDEFTKDNNGQKSALFIRCTLWRDPMASNLVKYCRKGSLVGVDGKLKQSSFVRQDGTKASSIEVVADSVQFLDTRKVSDDDNTIPMDVEPADDSKNLDSIDVTDEDLPF